MRHWLPHSASLLACFHVYVCSRQCQHTFAAHAFLCAFACLAIVLLLCCACRSGLCELIDPGGRCFSDCIIFPLGGVLGCIDCSKILMFVWAVSAACTVYRHRKPWGFNCELHPVFMVLGLVQSNDAHAFCAGIQRCSECHACTTVCIVCCH